jgi:hypothetical protein
MEVGDEGGDNPFAVMALIGFTKWWKPVRGTRPRKGKVARSVNSAPPQAYRKIF